MEDLKHQMEKKGRLLFGVFGFINSSLDLADLFGYWDLFGAYLRALPESLASPCTVLVVQERDPLIRSLIP